MTKFRKGDNVATTKDVGGIMRDHVPAGTPGVVIEAGWGAQAVVRFRIDGGIFSSDRTVDVRVSDDEIQ